MRTQRSFILCTLTLALVSNEFASAQQKIPDRWALLIGVDDYAEADDLSFCAADQRGLAERLVATGWPRDHLVLIESKASDSKLIPSRQNIEKQLRLLLDLVDDGDIVLFAFSGHGVHLDGKSYLCPFDGRLEEPASLIPLTEVYESLARSGASFKLALVDACRDDPRPGRRRAFSRGASAREFAKSLDKPPQGIAMLVSCGPLQQSIEDDEFGHGVFMHFVIDGLTGPADKDADGHVSLAELSRYVGERTKVHVARKYNDVQRPELKGELPIEAFDFPLATLAKGNITSTPLPLNPPSAESKPRAAGATLTNSLGMKLVLIPAGEFEMGSSESPDELLRRFAYADRGNLDDEQPVHKVKITRPFYLGAYEVTLGQFLVFYHDAGYRVDVENDGKGGTGIREGRGVKGTFYHDRSTEYVPWHWGHDGQTNDHPVVNISWNDATAFCQWLSKKEGKRYRLPTEAEWEYACRGGTSTRFWCGNDPEDLSQVDNVCDRTLRADIVARNYAVGLDEREYLTSSDGYVLTAPVGRFKPNPFGLYDLSGNASEWCQDWFGKNYYRESESVDPQGPAVGLEKCQRGGDWLYPTVYGRSANRAHYLPSQCDATSGFRIVCER